MLEFTGTGIKPHQMFNELDKFGLLLGLDRLSNERNLEYKERLLDVFANRADSTTRGLINGITRELGLKIKQEILVTPTSTDTKVGILIRGSKLCFYSDYYNKTILEINGVKQEYDLWDLEGGAYTLQEVLDIFSNTSIPFAATHLGSDLGALSATLLEANNFQEEAVETLSGKGIRISLGNNSIVEGTDYLFPSSFIRVATVAEISNEEHYHIDYISGTITTLVLLPNNAYIRYNYREEKTYIDSSPVIIGDLQSENLKEKMFEQVEQSNNEPAVSGNPTHFGADIINELLSVHPLAYNK
jgi:hypothetical protein